MYRAAALSVMLIAACGDAGDHADAHIVTTDAPMSFDARFPDGRGPDAPTPDAAIAASRVWITGDWLTDGVVQAGMFGEDATLPVVPAVVLPAGSDQLAAGAGALSLGADGGRVVYAAVDAGGAASVYVADPDGGEPTLLYAAPAGVEIDYVSIAPDGLRVVFTADLEVDGMVDLYLAPAAPTTTPFRISTARAADDPALDVIGGVAWSATSRYAAFAGELTEAGYRELYVADTSAPGTLTTLLSRADIAVPVAAGGAKGVTGDTAFDANNEVWFAARIAASATAAVELFRAPFIGGRTAVPTPLRTSGVASEPGALAIAPDGIHVAFSADAPTRDAFEIYYAAIDAPAATTRLTVGEVPTYGGAARIQFSPDGTRVAVVGDLTTAGIHEPYVLAVDGTSLVRLVVLPGARDALALGWNSAGTAVFCAGDLDVDGVTALFRLDPTGPQTPTLAVAVPPGGDIAGVLVH